MAGAVQRLNTNAEVSKRGNALSTNIAAARGLQSVLQSNLGPTGTLKMFAHPWLLLLLPVPLLR